MNYEIDTENLTEEERQELERIVKKAKRDPRQWPGYGEEYYYLTPSGKIGEDNWSDCEVDIDRFEFGNYFHTIEEAEFRVEELKVETELKRCMEKYNGEDFDILDNSVKKWYITYCFDPINVNYTGGWHFGCSKIVFETNEIAERAVKEVGEERILKYFFGVK